MADDTMVPDGPPVELVPADRVIQCEVHIAEGRSAIALDGSGGVRLILEAVGKANEEEIVRLRHWRKRMFLATFVLPGG